MRLDEQFAQLFRGRTDAYGTGRGGVVREPLTTWQYNRHLAGEGSGLGVFPLLDDGTVWFAAIDLDEPDYGAAAAMGKLLPGQTWVERSRSGNMHVLAFFCEPIEAWVVRGLLRRVAELGGKPRVEVFPKQDQLQPGMLGNYLNLAYHGSARPVFDCLGSPLRVDEFIIAAMSKRINPARWRARAARLELRPPEQREPTARFGESPVLHTCAQHILETARENPVREGHRAVVYFALSKQLLNWKMLGPEEAWDLLVMVNEEGDPPLDERELHRIFENARRGEWTSTGCDDPLFAPYAAPDCPIAHRGQS